MGDIVKFLVTESRCGQLASSVSPQGAFSFNNHFLQRLELDRCWKCRTISSNNILFAAGFSM